MQSRTRRDRQRHPAAVDVGLLPVLHAVVAGGGGARPTGADLVHRLDRRLARSEMEAVLADEGEE
jgi:hypothetical protein